MSMKKLRKSIVGLFILFLLLPCILVWLIQKDGKIILEGTKQIERYLPAVLYKTISSQMHIETLKAQAVILRSNITLALEEGTVTYAELQDRCSMMGRKWTEEEKDFYKRLVRACQDTEGEVVVYEGKICYCPYFYISSGITRDAFSFFQDDSYPYIVSVPSHRDEESGSYITYHYFSKQEFAEKVNSMCQDTYDGNIQILETDDAGYVTWIKVGDSIIGGEIFRKTLGLSSCCFSIEQADQEIRICCKGCGHGFGFSQYAANAMATERKDYRDLLEYYFHNIKIENVYTFT